MNKFKKSYTFDQVFNKFKIKNYILNDDDTQYEDITELEEYYIRYIENNLYTDINNIDTIILDTYIENQIYINMINNINEFLLNSKLKIIIEDNSHISSIYNEEDSCIDIQQLSIDTDFNELDDNILKLMDDKSSIVKDDLETCIINENIIINKNNIYKTYAKTIY